MRRAFDEPLLRQAFELLGRDLAGRGVFVEIAADGGSAMVLLVDRDRTTEDVDALVRTGFDERLLAPAVANVARVLDLAPDWLNDAVGMFTPLEEGDDLFEAAGSYPAAGRPGLRVVVAAPRYLLALKLHALRSRDRGERDARDARTLAAHLDITNAAELVALYASVYGEDPPPEAARRFPAVLGPRP